MDETRLVETVDPEEAFTALSDGTRVDILRALWDAGDPISFSDLRAAVGLRDSGQFNYHLDKLVGTFVRKTDDGYDLTLAGQQVNGAIHAGAYTMEGTVDAIELDDPCPACGGERTFHYENEHVLVDCDSCDVEATAGVPPGAFAGYDRAEFPAVAARYFRTVVQHVGNGICWYCTGETRPQVVSVDHTMDAPGDLPPAYEDIPLVRYDCRRCGAEITGDLGSSLVDHPAVVSFYYDHGVDVREHPYWEFTALSTDSAEITDRDPLQAEVTYTVADDALTLVLDETLDVRDVEGTD